MNILLAAATAFEIAPLIGHYRQKTNIAHELDILITGIGLTASTYSITRQLAIKKPDLVIQAGIAGGFDRGIPLATVVVVKSDTIADLGVVEHGMLQSVFDMGFLKPNTTPFKGGMLVNRSAVLKKIPYQKVMAISVNEITTSKQKIKLYQEKYKPVVESMEGSALHYVCLRENVPFLQLRSISNYVGERNKKKWSLHSSVDTLNHALVQLLQLV